MLVINWIKGFSLGLEYMDHPVVGFLVNLDLGIIRLTYYFNMVFEDDDE